MKWNYIFEKKKKKEKGKRKFHLVVGNQKNASLPLRSSTAFYQLNILLVIRLMIVKSGSLQIREWSLNCARDQSG